MHEQLHTHWITDFAEELAECDDKRLEEHITTWQSHQTRLATLKREGVNKPSYEALLGSYKAVRIAVTFLEDYRSHQWQSPQSDQ